ncbi:hypothetical protein B0H21DRAFT_449076 [Amylocystis lapponica]|nr:hypothetical protein B0H21DRAFT_449076 [Amylocystis lapponica]
MSDTEKDLDELQSDLDEVEDAGFHIGDRLQAPLACLYTTRKLHTLIHEGIIDLNPPYQRDIVWTEPKQIKLLDSIYRNFYVPPVVLAVYLDDEGEEIRRCVDGKQRLTSIQKFFDGQIPYRDPRTKKAYWYTCPETSKSTRLQVPEHWKQDFASKMITCVEYRNLPRGFERDIFQRVQMGMPLTAAEKLQAISSPWAEWISGLEARFISSDDGLTSTINVDMKRGRDFQCLAQLIYCCDGFPEHVVPTAQKMEQFVSRTEPPSNAFKAAVQSVLTEFWHLADTKGLNDAFVRVTQRVAPIEFVFIGVILFAMRDDGSSHRRRADEIYDMRQFIRKRFPDVRSRADIIKVLWSFVDGVVARMDGTAPIHAAPSDKKKKHKRKADDDDEMGDEYRPAKNGQVAKRTKGKNAR